MQYDICLINGKSARTECKTRSSATAEIAHDANDFDFSVYDVHSALTLTFNSCTMPSQTDGTDEPWNAHSRSLKVIRCCANGRGIYDFVLALYSNLTSISNRSWDHVLVSGAQNIALSNHKLKSVLKCTIWSQCMPVLHRQTDRQKDGWTSRQFYERTEH